MLSCHDLLFETPSTGPALFETRLVDVGDGSDIFSRVETAFVLRQVRNNYWSFEPVEMFRFEFRIISK